MKFALVQQAIPTSTGNVDYLDSNIASDWKYAYFYGSRAQSNATSTAIATFISGQMTAAAGGSVAIAAADGGATSQVAGVTTTNAIQVVNANGGTQATAAYASTQTTGPRINYSVAGSAAYLLNGLLLSGSDVEATVVSATFTNAAAPETLVVAHGLSGGAPHVIIAESYQNSQRISHGFYDVANDDYACHSYVNVTGQVGNTTLGGQVSDNCLLREVFNSGSTYAVTVTSIGATNVSLVATGATTSDVVKLTFLRITSASFRVGLFQTPTSTGDLSVTPASPSFTGTPSLLWMFPSALTALNTHSNTDTAGAYGCGIAVNNNGTIQQMTAMLSSDDAAALTVEKSYSTNDKCLAIQDATGAVDVEAQATFVVGGATLNFSNVSASGLYIPYLMAGPSVVAPTFIVSPTVTSQTSTAYTLGYTASTSSTFYAAAVLAGASTPSASQIKAGTGGGILFAANEAVTGADTTVLTLTGTLFPKYKLCCLLSNAAGDSSIVALDNEFLDPPTGKQFQVLTTPIASTSPLANASPAIATNDVWVIDTVTTPGSYAITPTADGDFSVASAGDESPQTIAHDVYDNSLTAYYGAGTIYLNYFAPIVSGTEVLAYPLNIAITPLDLTAYATDPQGNAITVTAIDTPPTGLSVASSSLTGTPTVKAITIGTYRFTGISGDYTDAEITIITGTITVPNVVGFFRDGAAAALNDVYLNAVGNLSGDIVISQTPAAASEVQPFSDVNLAFANGFGQLFGAGLAFRIRIGL